MLDETSADAKGVTSASYRDGTSKVWSRAHTVGYRALRRCGTDFSMMIELNLFPGPIAEAAAQQVHEGDEGTSGASRGSAAPFRRLQRDWCAWRRMLRRRRSAANAEEAGEEGEGGGGGGGGGR